MILAFTLILAILAAALCLFIGYQITFTVTMLHGPVFVPSADEKLKAMLSLPKISRSSKILDMGSGDGKVLLALAKKCRQPLTGAEINPLLVRKSRQRIKEAGLEKSISIKQQSFWDLDLGEYDIVFLYGTSYIMKKLEKKVLSEMKPGSQLVSNYFTFPNLKPVAEKNQVYLYTF
jgi:predicted O-methyltransferase YrrM